MPVSYQSASSYEPVSSYQPHAKPKPQIQNKPPNSRNKKFICNATLVGCASIPAKFKARQPSVDRRRTEPSATPLGWRQVWECMVRAQSSKTAREAKGKDLVLCSWTWVKCVFHTLAFATQPSLADPKCRQASSPSHILSLASRCACWPAIIDGSQNKLLAHVLTWGL